VVPLVDAVARSLDASAMDGPFAAVVAAVVVQMVGHLV
jgi:hypothetical protein